MASSEMLLRKLVDGSATLDERARALELIQKDPATARRHRAMVEAERALAGGPMDVPSAAELDALLPRILDAAQPDALRPAQLRGLPGLPGLPRLARLARLLRPRLAWIATPAIAATLVALVVTRGDDDFRPRGNEATPGASAGTRAPIPLEVFCVEGGAPRALSVSAPSCAVGATLVIGVPTSMAGAQVRLAFIDAAKVAHRAQGGAADAPDIAAVPDTGLPPLFLDIASSWALGRGNVVVDVNDATAQRPVDIIVALP